jgi:hypothetical protein
MSRSITYCGIALPLLTYRCNIRRNDVENDQANGAGGRTALVPLAYGFGQDLARFEISRLASVVIEHADLPFLHIGEAGPGVLVDGSRAAGGNVDSDGHQLGFALRELQRVVRACQPGPKDRRGDHLLGSSFSYARLCQI